MMTAPASRSCWTTTASLVGLVMASAHTRSGALAARSIDVVLHENRDSVQRAPHLALSPLLVHPVGDLDRVRAERQHRAQLGRPVCFSGYGEVQNLDRVPPILLRPARKQATTMPSGSPSRWSTDSDPHGSSLPKLRSCARTLACPPRGHSNFGAQLASKSDCDWSQSLTEAGLREICMCRSGGPGQSARGAAQPIRGTARPIRPGRGRPPPGTGPPARPPRRRAAPGDEVGSAGGNRGTGRDPAWQEDEKGTDCRGDRDRAGDPQAQCHRGREALVRRPHDQAPRTPRSPGRWHPQRRPSPWRRGRRSPVHGGRRGLR